MYKKWIVLGLMVSLILLLMILFLKPQQQHVKQQQTQLDKQKVSEIHSERTTKNALNDQSSKQKRQDKETHAQLLQQREQVFQQFQQINTQMSQGQQPNQNQVLTLLEQQYRLVEKGVVNVDEAISSIQYLRQILPEMDRFLDGQQAKLEQLKD
ncbi:hypothetical protein M5F00_13815 [Acinetobacter sp. ANC 4945]|uniref:Uncharacterized protein n=1 Tax=Acinetobacter amyesii TaxID=2942470 RepID=A0A1T1H7L1_9GAMM|nr:hypothetical protein [Acinetobacter amyesii]MCL6248938.1 hypothetical protein [Acinetobacter amyesii]OOV85710.1 hypothetical protein B1202_03520 [Acinetobacter amyesii]